MSLRSTKEFDPVADAALLARARAATYALQKGTLGNVDGYALLAAVVWPQSDILQRMGEALPDE